MTFFSHAARSALCACIAVFPAIALAQADAPPPPMPDAPAVQPPAADAKAEALARFDKGVVLFDAGKYDVALTEFLEARRIFPLRSATANAVVCLDQLGRYDEALEMVETLLREFGATMTEEARARAQRKLVELRLRVGTIEISGAEIGARILVDGRDRGAYPPLAPLRVNAGTHLLRVIRAGFEPFEQSVDVPGGGGAAVFVKQQGTMRSGRVSIVEQTGKKLDIVMDGVVAGQTPWEGPLPLGDHVVFLKGNGALGTLPTPLTIVQDQVVRLSLLAEELTARLRIEPSPPNAVIAVDGITLGRGVWEGALRAGTHHIEVAAPDFLPTSQNVQIAQGGRRVVVVSLQRNPRSAFAVKAAHFLVDGQVNFYAAPAFGGDVGAGFGRGVHTLISAGYELPSHWSFGMGLGAVAVKGSSDEHLIAATPIELSGVPQVRNIPTVDSVTYRGGLIAAWGGVTFGDKTPVQLRLRAGTLLGTVALDREGVEALEGEWSMVGKSRETHPLRALYLAPEMRIGVSIRPGMVVSFGLSAFLLYHLSVPTWDADRKHEVVLNDPSRAPAYGLLGSPNTEPVAFASPLEIAIFPGFGFRYDL